MNMTYAPHDSIQEKSEVGHAPNWSLELVRINKWLHANRTLLKIKPAQLNFYFSNGNNRFVKSFPNMWGGFHKSALFGTIVDVVLRINGESSTLSLTVNFFKTVSILH